jgi:hypothetical protein
MRIMRITKMIERPPSAEQLMLILETRMRKRKQMRSVSGELLGRTSMAPTTLRLKSKHWSKRRRLNGYNRRSYKRCQRLILALMRMSGRMLQKRMRMAM